jgi:hypothetical protein
VSTNIFHKPFISAYRMASFVALSGILLIAVGYLFLLIFYTINTVWAAPIQLSPSQDRVLAFQPQVASLEAALLKQKVDLATAEAKYQAGTDQLANINALLRRIDGAQKTELKALNDTNASIRQALADKRIDIGSTERSIADATAMLKSVDAELASGLITRDQAQTRRITLQAALNSATDAKAQALALQEQARVAKEGAATLGGGSSSLLALQSIQQAVQLRLAAVQLTIDTETARQTAEQLRASIPENERVLAVAKTSPYHLALRQTVDVLFVPYDNIHRAKAGEPIYDCYLQVIVCHKVGQVTKVYTAEEYARHPLFKTDLKGQFVGIQLDEPKAARSQVLFIGSKPLFL